MGDRPEKALQEFVSESQETVETLSRTLLRLDADRATGRLDAGLVNDAFRAVHTLKGLAAVCGAPRMQSLAHNIENLLDELRLGRLELGPPTLDLLFESVDLLSRLVAEAGQAGAPVPAAQVDDLVERLDRIGAQPHPRSLADSPWGPYEIDQYFLSGLTEFEAHRLRENIRQGRTICRVHATFPLLTVDRQLDGLRARLKAVGEVVTLVPMPSPPGEDETLVIDLIAGVDGGVDAAQAAIGEVQGSAIELPRRRDHRPLRLEADDAPGDAEPLPAAPLPVDPPPVEPAPPETPSSLRSAAQTVRVDIGKLDHLMNMVGELALARSGIQRVLDDLRRDGGHPDLARALHRELRNLGRRLDELQAGILEVRMVPLGQLFDKLSRVVRRMSREAGKDVHLSIRGADTELDKLIVEELSDPLMHVIRNCIDHGIEPAPVRARAAKPEAGAIEISAEQRGNHVVLSVADDGAGLDEEKLVARAVERGFIEAGAAASLSRRDVFNLMFLPGLSTRDTPGELSGRGVGMDVVKTNISRLSGLIDVESEPGRGTRLTVTLPITLAIIQALVVRVAGRTYTMPLGAVLEAVMVAPGDLRTIERREVMTLRGATLPILRLERAFRLSRSSPPGERAYVVVVGMAQHRVGVLVDEMLGQQDVVIKSLGRALDGVPGIAGATELGGQQTVLVLDVAGLVEEAVREREVA